MGISMSNNLINLKTNTKNPKKVRYKTHKAYRETLKVSPGQDSTLTETEVLSTKYSL